LSDFGLFDDTATYIQINGIHVISTSQGYIGAKGIRMKANFFIISSSSSNNNNQAFGSSSAKY
jgi:hypothetical protein